MLMKGCGSNPVSDSVSVYPLVYRLCLGAWTDHGERTGGFYACNRYETAKQEGVVCLCKFF